MNPLKSGNITSGATGIAQMVRDHIKKHDLKEGDRLPTHAELSTSMGVGMRRLREGLCILEQEGLIVTRRKGGTLVAQPQLKVLDDPIGRHLDLQGCTFTDLVRARALLEGAVAAEAARKRTARDLLVMLDAIEQMERRTDRGEPDDEEDEAFHVALLSATHNPAMQVFGQLIHSQFLLKAREHLTPSRLRQEAGVDEHRKILASIESRDQMSAREHMETHVLLQLKEKRTRRG